MADVAGLLGGGVEQSGDHGLGDVADDHAEGVQDPDVVGGPVEPVPLPLAGVLGRWLRVVVDDAART
ncbi:MAG TPA: hypothetical protein VFP34_18585 [Microlunatus sp.]|nr:hypothetical protein [Microlunatus sp.]